MPARRALITGVTGQDGAYLARLLLDKGYKVFGTYRRLSTPNFWRLQYLGVFGKVNLIPVDLADMSSIVESIRISNPHEVYNLAAQSYVGASFEQPLVTADVSGVSAVRFLEVIRQDRIDAKFYQASTSEMYGYSGDGSGRLGPGSPFAPMSPYAAAKLYAHWIVRVYRDAYGIFACSGVLFNHECFAPSTPLITRTDGWVDCLPMIELMPNWRHERQRELDFEVWDKEGWTRAILGTVNYMAASQGGELQSVRVRSGEIRTTIDHKWIQESGESILCEDIKQGDMMLRAGLPDPPNRTKVTEEWAELLGLLAAEGYSSEGERVATFFTNKDQNILDRVQAVWETCTGGSVSEGESVSGFTGEPIRRFRLLAPETAIHTYLRQSLYTEAGDKRVPRTILNADAKAWFHFLRGYNLGDGLKAGNGIYEFKNFKTASPTLAASTWWMASKILNQRLVLNVESTVKRGGLRYEYYSANLNSPMPGKGAHLIKPSAEVKSLWRSPYTGPVVDIATESGTLHAGVGDLIVHNSPIRGLEFVTRKITNGVAKIKLGVEKKLALGNLNARRDWGYAPEYVEAIWKMLQQDKPEDFIIATGVSHSVQQFAEAAFEGEGMDWRRYVRVDRRFMRPLDVLSLAGDSSSAAEKLGWRPRTNFKQLVDHMLKEDVGRWTRWLNGEHFPWDAPNYPSEARILTRTLRM